jgi:hypothetical protein
MSRFKISQRAASSGSGISILLVKRPRMAGSICSGRFVAARTKLDAHTFEHHPSAKHFRNDVWVKESAVGGALRATVSIVDKENRWRTARL